jgi:hypothetical protein
MMKTTRNQTLAATPGFWIIVVLSSAAMVLLAVFANTTMQLAALSVLVAVGIGVLWEIQRDWSQWRKNIGILDTPLFLAHDADLFEHYQSISRSLLIMSQNPDDIYRKTILRQVGQISDQLTRLAAGTIVYEETETWRLAYENLLRSTGLHLYRSVAWVKTPQYWQDEPGLQSMRLNYELLDSGRLNIERIVILAAEVWPEDEPLPKSPIREWIHEQHTHGIWTKLVRESSLRSESGLLVDMGIYGSRAVGTQELDDQGRTVRFTLTFDFDAVAAAEERWRRLSVYATSYGDLLDHCRFDE